MEYQQFKIATTPEMAEIIPAFLSELGFDTFEIVETGVEAYIPSEIWTEEVAAEVQELEAQFGFSYQQTTIAPQNWNAEWEANFQPVTVRDFCHIRASFHEKKPDMRFDLLINPKMAFGTGHHETTYMVVDMMESLDFEGKKVLDYGCGTGILAILASKLGAAVIDAIDIEEEAYLNTVENAALNDVENIVAMQGTLTDLKRENAKKREGLHDDDNYDIVLANINRNVIADSLVPLYLDVKFNGYFIFSGFMDADEEYMRLALANNSFSILKTVQRGKWLCMLCQKYETF